jgi:hypothetical protein
VQSAAHFAQSFELIIAHVSIVHALSMAQALFIGLSVSYCKGSADNFGHFDTSSELFLDDSLWHIYVME